MFYEWKKKQNNTHPPNALVLGSLTQTNSHSKSIINSKGEKERPMNKKINLIVPKKYKIHTRETSEDLNCLTIMLYEWKTKQNNKLRNIRQKLTAKNENYYLYRFRPVMRQNKLFNSSK